MAGAKLLTSTELAKLASRTAGRKCTARRVRHLLVQGGLGTELQPRRQGQTRLFGALDLAILRVALELEQQGISAQVIRVVLTYLRDDLVRAYKSAAPLALAVNGLRGRLEPTLRTKPASAVAWVPLREIWKGLDQEISGVRDAKPTVWMWAEVPLQAVKRFTV
jgi:DNA-binding transcriptional MerR regulator